MYAYSDPNRENDENALPNIEISFLGALTIQQEGLTYEDGEPLEEGYYWQACFPGCMPDGELVGPFETQAAAIEDARRE